jgi:hypothetical protein
MNQPNPQQYPQQQPQQPYPQQMAPGQYPPGPYPQYPPPKQGMSSGAKIAIIIACVVVGVFVLGGVLVGVLAVATVPKLAEAQQKLEIKQVGDQVAALQSVAADDMKKRKLRRHGELAGAELWSAMLRDDMVDGALTPRLVSLNTTTDTPASSPHSVGPNNCSYTLPRGDQLMRVMGRRGGERTVLITFNSRNWNNYPNQGVVVQWSDSEMAEWMTFEQAQADWGITQAEWNDPAGKLFGKKAPFQHTYE